MQWWSSIPAVSALVFFALSFFSQVSSWSYSNVYDWGTEYEDYCSGQKQSPINLADADYDASFIDDSFDVSDFESASGVTWAIKNNGHTVQVDVGGTAMNVSGGNLNHTYQVAQFHFHWGSINTQGSEHTVDGSKYPMEMHIVTFNTDYDDLTDAAGHSDGLAVLGIFFEISSSANSDMANIVTALSNITTADSNTSVSVTPVSLNSFLPNITNYWRYSGSLTTPNCNEVVTWTVFRETISLSQTQLDAFRGLEDSHGDDLEDNYRPVQSLNSRTLKASFSAACPTVAAPFSTVTLLTTALLVVPALLSSAFNQHTL